MKENRYEARMNEIFSRYCETPEGITEEYFIERFKKIASDLDKEPWAIFGAGLVTKWLNDQVPFSQFQNLSCILDNKETVWETEFCGVPVKKPSFCLENNVNAILSTPTQWFDEIKEGLLEINPSFSVLNFFRGSFSFQGYEVGRPVSVSHNSKYEDLYVYENLYQESTNETEKKFFLERKIAICLYIRDFINLFELIDFYVEKYGAGHYDLLKKEVEALLVDLRKTLQAKQSRDVIVVLLDALPADLCYDSEIFPYLNQLAKEGTYYTHAYSPGVFTSESLSAMFQEKPVVKLNSKKNRNQLSFKKVLKENSYKSKGTSSLNILKISPFDEEREFFYSSDCLWDSVEITQELPRQFWQHLCFIASEKGKCFSFIHAIEETHPHYLCSNFGNIKIALPDSKTALFSQESQALADKRIPTVYSFVDQQSEFYLSMLHQNVTKFIFSDHGHHIKSFYSLTPKELTIRTNSVWFHIPLIVHGGSTPSCVKTNLFSTLKSTDLIEDMITGKSSSYDQDFVQVGFMKYRNKKMREIRIAHDLAYEIDGFNLFLDKEYKIVRNAHGEFKYYLMEDETQEVTDPDTIQKIRDRFLHLYDEEEYYT